MDYKEQIIKMDEMELGDRIYPDPNTSIIRVLGGWIYSDMQGCCFIPKEAK